jgi:hypothetical protein
MLAVREIFDACSMPMTVRSRDDIVSQASGGGGLAGPHARKARMDSVSCHHVGVEERLLQRRRESRTQHPAAAVLALLTSGYQPFCV